MNKPISILLLIIFLNNSFGYYIAFLFEQKQIRNEIKEKIEQSLPENELTIIFINNDETSLIKWFEKDKEFSFNDEMYDVIRNKITKTGTIYFCIHDKDEKKLNQKLNLYLIDQKNCDTDSKNKDAGRFIKINKSDFFKSTIFFFLSPVTMKSNFFFITEHLKSLFKEVPTPPPKFSLSFIL